MMEAIAYSDKSRDYTISVQHPMQQTPYPPGTVPPTQAPSAPVSSWDPATFTGQSYASASPTPPYIGAAMPPFGSPSSQTNPGSTQVSGTQPTVLPGGTSLPGQPTYYGS